MLLTFGIIAVIGLLIISIIPICGLIYFSGSYSYNNRFVEMIIHNGFICFSIILIGVVTVINYIVFLFITK